MTAGHHGTNSTSTNLFGMRLFTSLNHKLPPNAQQAPQIEDEEKLALREPILSFVCYCSNPEYLVIGYLHGYWVFGPQTLNPRP